MSVQDKSGKKPVLLLNGPNLNLLGVRNKQVYGAKTLPEITKELEGHASHLGLELSHAQYNGEGDLITAVQQARQSAKGLIINAGGYSHTSIALRDALECFEGPVIEVHLSNIAAREEYRRHSYVSEVAQGVIFGMGPLGYKLALHALADMLP